MKPGSTIINIGSVLGFTTDSGLPQAAYCSTKAAIVGLTRSWPSSGADAKGSVSTPSPRLLPVRDDRPAPASTSPR
jgi:NAD(P)-dependent dehydrogenase (short-subunit alcohol dehydrogenase family)